MYKAFSGIWKKGRLFPHFSEILIYRIMKKIEIFCGVLKNFKTGYNAFVFWTILGETYYRTSFLDFNETTRSTNKRGSLRYNFLKNVTFTVSYETYGQLLESAETPKFSFDFGYQTEFIKVHKFLVSFDSFKDKILNYCNDIREDNKTFTILNNEILNYMSKEELKEALKELDVFVDFNNGDKFMITPDEIDLEHKRLILKGSQGQLKWVRIDERYDKKRKS